MSVLLICLSTEHGNTRKLAEAMAGELDAKVVEPAEVDVDSLDEHELIGFGSGIRFARHYRELFDLVGRLPRQVGKHAFVFSTSGFGFRWWHGALRKRLVAKGFVIQDEHCCQGLDIMGLLRLFGGVNKGKPDDQDLAAARAFARRLKG